MAYKELSLNFDAFEKKLKSEEEKRYKAEDLAKWRHNELESIKFAIESQMKDHEEIKKQCYSKTL